MLIPKLMKNKNLKYYIFIGILLLILIFVEYSKPQPIDWRETYSHEDKIPFGTYVLFNTIQDLFPNNKIEVNNRTVYEFTTRNPNSIINYIFITDIFEITNTDIEALKSFVEKGNTAFIAANYIADSLQNNLNIKITNNFDLMNKSLKFNFHNQKFTQKTFKYYDIKFQNFYFSEIDTLNTIILASDSLNNPIFIKQKFGKGYFYLCTQPKAFTNYSLITHKNYKFAYNALSYLPETDIIWENYYKPFKNDDRSVFEYIFSNYSLRYAFYILIIGIIIFMLSSAKRNQRIIPVIEPLQNFTVDFVKTLGRVYYKSKNHKDICIKKFTYFNEYLFSNYHIKTSDIENVNFDEIAEKTGVDSESISKIFITYRNILKENSINNEQLGMFNMLIDKFYNQSK